MAYYVIPKCAKRNLPAISELCLRIGMKASLPEEFDRGWLADHKDMVHLVHWSAHAEYQLMLQTDHKITHKNPAMAGFLVQMLALSGSKELYEYKGNKKLIDIAELQ